MPAGPIQLSALDYGDPEHPPMVLLHGSSDLAWSLDSVAQAFADRYRVIGLDLRGHGHSDHPGAYSVLHYVADLERVVDHFGLADRRPVLVGHSLGGHIVAQFCGLYPEVSSALVLVEGTGPPARVVDDGPDARADFARMVIGVLQTPLRHKPLADLDAAVARLAATHPRLDPERARFLAEVGTRPGPDGGPGLALRPPHPGLDGVDRPRGHRGALAARALPGPGHPRAPSRGTRGGRCVRRIPTPPVSRAGCA